MAADFLYQNPPLIEVIAEVRWGLVQLGTVPGTAIDPHFEAISRDFLETMRREGYTTIERLVPEGIPLELLNGQALYRCRKSAGHWPLYQIGPGVFTSNIVPEYGGWAAFRSFLAAGFRHLLAAYPVPEKLMKISSLELRYIDAFTEVHGIEEEGFVERQLGFSIAVPSALTKVLAKDQTVILSGHFLCQSHKPEVGLHIRVGQGSSANKPAIILDLRSVSKAQIAPAEKPILEWFDAAHAVLHDSFELITSEQLKTRMGPKIELVRAYDASTS